MRDKAFPPDEDHVFKSIGRDACRDLEEALEALRERSQRLHYARHWGQGSSGPLQAWGKCAAEPCISDRALLEERQEVTG